MNRHLRFRYVTGTLALVLLVLVVGCTAEDEGAEGTVDRQDPRLSAAVGAAGAAFEPQEDGSWLVENDTQRVRARVSTSGLHVSPTGRAAPVWGLTLRVDRIGREDRLADVAAATPTAEGTSVRVSRPALEERYTNHREALALRLRVDERPEPYGPGGPLILAFSVATGLLPRSVPGSGDQAVEFLTARHVPVFRFQGLRATDATGQPLSARLAWRDGELQISVADQAAVYPIFLDGSLSSTNEGSTSTLPLLGGDVVQLEGTQLGAGFGFSVATAGDVNGDGHSDVIVGAPGIDGNRGSAYVYLGSPLGLAPTPVWFATGAARAAQMGYVVGTAGDVNGDGYSDVIVSEPGYHGVNVVEPGYDDSAAQRTKGRVSVYLGSAGGIAATPAWTMEVGQPDASLYGLSASTAGDVNGDGYGDVVIGVPGFDDDQTNEGRVFVYLGSITGLSATPSWTMDSNQEGGMIGRAVATAGDVNGDGYSDVIVGAPSIDDNRGRAYVYLGSPTGLAAAPGWVADGQLVASQQGRWVATAGDVDGDGYGDVAVGTGSGRILVYQGTASGLAAVPVADLPGGVAATAGDVDGDGYSDLVVGSSDSIVNRPYGGTAFVYLGSASGLGSSPAWSVDSEQSGERLGYAVATAGDVDGDGRGDVVIGSPYFVAGQEGEGRIGVYLTSQPRLWSMPFWSMVSEQVGAWLGYSVASAGDVNGDGYGDVVLGAPKFHNGSVQGGKVIVYLGTADGLAAAPHWVVEGQEDGALLGYSVAGAGDVNGDGFGDVLVGAPGAMPGGKAYLWLGADTGLAPGSEESAAWTGVSTQPGARFGHSVAAAGDVNGDGFADIVVGAPLHDDAQADEGGIFVFAGSSTGLSVAPDWVAGGDQPGAHFGWSVAGAGDTNADGYSDIVVGAPEFDAEGGSDNGAVFVWHGAPDLPGGAMSGLPSQGTPSNSDWSFALPVAEAAGFGHAVASAGDLNGDGFSDVVVGAPYWGAGALEDEGMVYAYLGSAAGLDAYHYVRGNQLEAKLGWSVGRVANHRMSGHSAVLAGAPFFDFETGRNTGRVLVWSDLGDVTADWNGSLLAPAERDPTHPDMADPGPMSQFGFSVASAGDVDGDGREDVIVGAPFYDDRHEVAGMVVLYRGPAMERLPRQLNVDNWGFVAPLGKSDSERAFRIGQAGRSPGGRARVRLEWEAKPVGTPFDGDGLQRAPQAWDTGEPGERGSVVPLEGTVTGLEPGRHYHWRARVLTDSPFFPRSPWFMLLANSPSEKKLRTAGDSNQTPNASPVGEPITGLAPLTVTFDGTASSDPDGNVVRYIWDFGDGATAEGAVTVHTYTSAGTFVATLTVTDDGGAVNRSSEVVVEVTGTNQRPSASIQISPVVGISPLTVRFDGSASGDVDGSITATEWLFGDGDSFSGAIAEHTFTTAGIYRATLEVTDDKNAKDSVTGAVTVASASSQVLALTRLPGLAGGTPAKTAVYRADLSEIGLDSISSITIADGGAGVGGAAGPFSGLDLDGIKLANTSCPDAACAADLPGLAVFDFSALGQAVFTPGSQRPPQGAGLFGSDATGSRVDDSLATLGLLDGDASTSASADKFLSLGDGGVITLNLTEAMPTDGLFLYIGEANDTGEMGSGQIIASQERIGIRSQVMGTIRAARAAVDRGERNIDLDGDGFKEYRRILDDSGRLQREEVDVNGDGAPDAVWDYRGEAKTFSMDANANGVAEEARVITRDSAAPYVSNVVVIEDADEDGAPDRRIAYVVDPTSDSMEIQNQEDTDRNGSYDLEYTVTTTRLQPDSPWHDFNPGCSAEQKRRVDDAIERVIADGFSCLDGMDPDLAWQFARLLAGSRFVFSCGTFVTGCGQVDAGAIADYQQGELNYLPIDLSGNAFDGGCGPLEQTIFHEMLHYLVGPHVNGEAAGWDTGDRIYGCEETCFGDATSQTCAACLGTSNDDARCDQFPYRACVAADPVPSLCSCDNEIYPSQVECAVHCMQGLSCFSFSCQPLSGPCR